MRSWADLPSQPVRSREPPSYPPRILPEYGNLLENGGNGFLRCLCLPEIAAVGEIRHSVRENSDRGGGVVNRKRPTDIIWAESYGPVTNAAISPPRSLTL